MKKIVIDEARCLKLGLTLQEALIALAISMGKYKETVTNMTNRSILIQNIFSQGSPDLSPEWEKKVSSMLSSDDERLKALAMEMQQCFPEGKKPGTVYYFRCNVREIVNKLKKFFEVYGDYDDDNVIAATKKFVASFNGDYRLMPLIKYFISKNKKVMGENGEISVNEVSELATTLENMSDDEEGIPEISDSDDWLMSSRN